MKGRSWWFCVFSLLSSTRPEVKRVGYQADYTQLLQNMARSSAGAGVGWAGHRILRVKRGLTRPEVATNPEGATNFAKSLLEVQGLGRAVSVRQEWLALQPRILILSEATCLLASRMFHSWISRNAHSSSSYLVFNFGGKVRDCRSIAEDWTVLGWLRSPTPRAKMVCRSSTSIRQASRQASAHASSFYNVLHFPFRSFRVTFALHDFAKDVKICEDM